MRKVTIVVLISTVFLLIGYDFLAAYIGGESATISAVVWYYAKIWPVLAFGMGILTGHLLWSQSTPKN